MAEQGISAAVRYCRNMLIIARYSIKYVNDNAGNERTRLWTTKSTV